MTLFILLTIAQEPYSIWYNVFFYLFIATLTLSIFIINTLFKKINNKDTEINTSQKQYTAKLDNLRKDHGDVVEKLRNEMLKKEEERTRQWMESEKETLHVLNGVSQVLELSENISKMESEKILTKLNEIINIVEKKNNTHEKNGEIKGS